MSMREKRDFNPYQVVKAGYEVAADPYHAQRDRWHNIDLLDQFTKLLPGREGKVLDVGCGAGVPVAEYFAQAGYEVVGVDISESMIRLARANVPKATFACANMVTYDFPPNEYIGLTCCYALIHVPQEEHQKVVNKFARTLKPGGALLLSVGRGAWEGREEFHGAQMFWSHPSPELSQEAVVGAGFQIIMAKPILIGQEEHFWILARKAI